MHLVGFLLILNYNAWNHELEICKIFVEILGGSRHRFGDYIRIDTKEFVYEVANSFQTSSTDCYEHTLIINRPVSYMVGITFSLSERLIHFAEGFYPRELVIFCRHINAVLLTEFTAAGGDRNRQPLVIKLHFKMFTSRV